MMWGWNGWGYPAPFFWLAHAAFWLVLIWGAILLIRGRRRLAHHDRAGEILRERYARGEISKEDFSRMKGDLEGK